MSLNFGISPALFTSEQDKMENNFAFPKRRNGFVDKQSVFKIRWHVLQNALSLLSLYHIHQDDNREEQSLSRGVSGALYAAV